MFLAIVIAICLGQSFVGAIELTTGFVQLSTLTTDRHFVRTTKTETYTQTSSVWPTAPVTGSPISSSVVTLDGLPITKIVAAIPTDAPFASTNPSRQFGNDVTSSSTLTVIYGPVVVTPPPSCTRTSFRYVTSAILGDLNNLQPSEIEAALSQIEGATRSSFSTDMRPGQQSPGTTSWAQVNIYLPTGVASPTLTSSDLDHLAQCYDPRRFGCPMAENTAVIAGCPIDRVPTGYPLPVDGDSGATPISSSMGGAAAPTGQVGAVFVAAAAGLGIAIGAAI
ncbi:hypothetical protein P152DRAFT_477920 [Eremomyces bilateralis CBS 781.70]|uniref:Uncharacterized protein n=1 Tax=Eremomyces bilateralis CBS 781.70 TaxID=1392243 RepID=A0A6G1GG40_9PEZI|nr:uncharacterized protein P152DRAFT_477920 [Eremomyces bilateralis CBS 781.70]KAF1816830.1 hypothetical protein P152DRAFT_477920 [Eremomyces bilateralis CBS 781.70]